MSDEDKSGFGEADADLADLIQETDEIIKETQEEIVIPDTAADADKSEEAEGTNQPSVSVKHSDVFHIIEDEDTIDEGVEENDPFDEVVGTVGVFNGVEDEDISGVGEADAVTLEVHI